MNQPRPWYEQGLRFACTQCGRCCRGAPGKVWVSDQEVEALAAHLGIEPLNFRRRYTFTGRSGGVSLRDRGRQHDYQCVFYDAGRGCTVYTHRPRQCRTWPFWQSVVRSRRSWQEHAVHCPGMNQGPFHEAELIATTAADDGIA